MATDSVTITNSVTYFHFFLQEITQDWELFIRA